MDSFMVEAIKEAYKGIKAGHGGPFGAVVVKEGKIVGRGHNEVIKRQDATCHGEMMAIRAASKRLKTFDLTGAVIYTTGYPCPMCMGAILWSNLSKVYYGCNVVDAEKIGFRDEAFYERLKEGEASGFVTELGREECLRLYADYAAAPDAKNY